MQEIYPIGIGDNARRCDCFIREGGFRLVITNIRNYFSLLQLFPRKIGGEQNNSYSLFSSSASRRMTTKKRLSVLDFGSSRHGSPISALRRVEREGEHSPNACRPLSSGNLVEQSIGNEKRPKPERKKRTFSLSRAQSRTCSGYAEARKRRMKFNEPIREVSGSPPIPPRMRKSERESPSGWLLTPAKKRKSLY